MQSAYFRVKGKVQGVFFRAGTKDKADELGVNGWVRNTEDGDVEVLAQGSTDLLNQLENWCRQGPARAKVVSVERSDRESEEFTSFVILR
jgi:acylphosphatase